MSDAMTTLESLGELKRSVKTLLSYPVFSILMVLLFVAAITGLSLMAFNSRSPNYYQRLEKRVDQCVQQSDFTREECLIIEASK